MLAPYNLPSFIYEWPGLLTRDMEVGVETSTRVGLVYWEGVISGVPPLSSKKPHFRDLYGRPFRVGDN